VRERQPGEVNKNAKSAEGKNDNKQQSQTICDWLFSLFPLHLSLFMFSLLSGKANANKNNNN